MRDTVLLLGFIAMLVMGRVFRFPHVGVLLWCWTALVIPTDFAYGFASTIPYNKVVAIITLLAWLLSREPKALPPSTTLVLFALFGIWGTISALTGISASGSTMVEWENFIKIIVFPFVVAGLMTSKGRIMALLYAVCLSLGFHGVLSGAKYLASGGSSHIFGPGLSIIGDNNAFALAMITLLPVLFFLYRQSNHRFIRLGFVGSIILVLAAIMGTASRGGLIGTVALGSFALLRSSNKFRNIGIAALVVLAALAFAPEQWNERMDTIKEADADSSFMGRVIAWKMSALVALDNPIFGGGFHATQEPEIWMKYADKFRKLDFITTGTPDPLKSFAAHSIYFQTLGDLGFVGLGIFVAILSSSWRNASVIMRAVRDRTEWLWAADLAKFMQFSLFAYVVTGSALSMAYFDYMYMLFAILVALRRLVTHSLGASVSAQRIT